MKKNIKHFILLTTFAAGAIHLVNRFVDHTAEMKNILKSQTGDFYGWKNGNIYYTKRGSGSPVLLIHDLDPISSSYEWCRIVKKLEKTHTVYTLDLLGCGRSDKPCLTYTNYLYVQLITDFIKNIIEEKPDVIVTGSSVSFAVLAQNMDHDLMKRIIAINPPAVSDFNQVPDKNSIVRKTLLKLPIIGTLLYNIKTHETNIAKCLRKTYFHKPQLVSSKMLDAYYEAAHLEHSHGKYLMASIDGRYTYNSIIHALKRLEIPVSVIMSSNLQNAVSIGDSYLHSNFLVETSYISNAGKVPQLEVPDKLLNIIHMFLND